MTPNGIEWRAHAHTQPHVISLYGAAVGTQDLMLVMEYAQNGTSLSLSISCDQDQDRCIGSD